MDPAATVPPAPSQHIFRPTCTHITVIRVYGGDRVYETCRQHGTLGWLYQCTQDMEEEIKKHLTERYPTKAPSNATKSTLDKLQAELSQIFDLEHGNDPRALSCIERLTPQEATRYQPEQLAKLVQQRLEVVEAIKRQVYGQEVTSSSQDNHPPNGDPALSLDNPRSEVLLCRYMVCQNCRPMMAGRCNISLDAAAHGKALPTAVIGCGFAWLDGLPIIDANIIKGFPGPLTKRDGTIPMSTTELLRLLETEIKDRQLNRILPEQSRGSLRHSPACDNLGSIAKIQQQLQTSWASRSNESVPRRLLQSRVPDEADGAAKENIHTWSRVTPKDNQTLSIRQTSQRSTEPLGDMIIQA